MDPKDDSDEDLSRRQREISVFSTMAAGGSFVSQKTDTTAPETTIKTSHDKPSLPSDDSTGSAAAFAQAASNVEDSGTFAMKSKSKGESVAVSSNLEAALAALTGEKPTRPVVEAFVPPNFPRIPATSNQSNMPMHSERVLMPRPLFFGPLLPPRVLRETRQLVADVMKERGIKGSAENPPPVSLFPPQIRNLIGAIDVFGYGLSPFPSENEPDESDPEYYTGNPYVSTFQPVWGASTRAERESERNRRCTRRVSSRNRSAREGGTQEPCSDGDITATRKHHQRPAATDGKSERNLFSLWAQGSDDGDVLPASIHSDEKPTSTNDDAKPTQPMADQNLFSQWARGDVSPSTSLSPSNEKNLRHNGGKQSNPTTKSNSDPNTRMTDKNHFSLWARGDVSPVASLSPPTESDSILNGKETSEIALKNDTETTTPITDKDLFSAWARGDVSSNLISTSLVVENPVTDQDQFSKWALGNEARDEDTPIVPKAISEQDLFSQWARGESSFGTRSGTLDVKKQSVNSNTFRHVVPLNDDSDDESVVGSEMKKKVGMNEHLDAALASFLQGDKGQSPAGPGPTAGESLSAADSQALLSQLAQTTFGGRPLTNFELTNGCVPVYGCDDPSLPTESDLGIYETKEEQIRTIQASRSQEIVDKYSIPNIFGPIACPSPCSGPDDNHSWNSRSIAAKNSVNTQTITRPGAETLGIRRYGLPCAEGRVLQSFNEPRPIPPPSSRRTTSASAFLTTSQSEKGKSADQNSLLSARGRGKLLATHERYGWWSIDDNDDEQEEEGSPKDDGFDSDFQRPPLEHVADSLVISNRLIPPPSLLKEENVPLSHMHAATSIANTLPFLSDRPPSWRYVQVDAKAVGFRPVGGEIEPLFCSLAIYHVETQPSTTASANEAPIPNLQRCGRVTEVLNFDVVTDKDVEARCRSALWPYLDGKGDVPASERTQGTRCGVFPIPANLNLANLYAIIIIRKVFSDDSDIDAYMPPSESSASLSMPPVDLSTYRSKAEKASQRQGKILTPFAFGVAPILQVFGTDLPTVAASRAVGIPLFRLRPGLGDRPIIDHIMVMLYPRANHKGAGISGPAPLTNGGQAMLVMRNYGFLGLHNVVDSKSKIARQRLVNFSGELQVRERRPCDRANPPNLFAGRSDHDYVVPAWHTNFLSEPTMNGGRNVVDVNSSVSDSEHATSLPEKQSFTSPTFYAQELAPVPLQLNPPLGSPLNSPFRMARRTGLSKDAEPTFNTSFCNELLCTPRLLHHCPKGSFVIKVEFRELEWRDSLDGFLAELPHHGPCLYNPRRGPAFVHEAFTSCLPSTSFSYFMEEFKMRLPLTLQRYDGSPACSSRKLVILFSVYRFGTKTKKSWMKTITKRLGGSKLSDTPSIIGEDSDGHKSRLRFVCCGYAPVTLHGDICSLIGSGLYDVKMSYTASLAPEGMSEKEGALILRQHVPPRSDQPSSVALSSNSPTEEAESRSGERVVVDTAELLDDSLFGSEPATSEAQTNPENALADYDTIMSAVSESTMDLPTKIATSTPLEAMILQIRIVMHSSLHPQNATLRDFLQRFPDRPAALDPTDLDPSSVWRLNRAELIEAQEKEIAAVNTYNEDEHFSRMVVSTIDISKPALCSSSITSVHWIRTVSQLLRICIAGKSEPSLLWANPAALIPLRIHAFASLLQLINSCSGYLMKNGATQLDGKSKWNVTTLGRLVAMVFDESMLFDSPTNHVEEPFDPVDIMPATGMAFPKQDESKIAPEAAKGHRKRHTRSNSDNLFISSDAMSNGNLVVSDDWKGWTAKQNSATLPPEFGKHLFAVNQIEIKNLGKIDSPGVISTGHLASRGKVDSKSDFQHALMAGYAEDSLSVNMVEVSAGNTVGTATGSNSRRKYMTLPTPALATIREDEPGETDLLVKYTRQPKMLKSAVDDAVDTEMFTSEKNTSIKQMRVPKVSSKIADTSKTTSTATQPGGEVRAVLTNEKDIESAGTAFLDVIGQNLGYGSNPRKSQQGGEEQRVGHANHRKTRSRCSIDWTLPDVEVINSSSQTDTSISTVPSTTPTHEGLKATPRNEDKSGAGHLSYEIDLTMSALKDEKNNCHALPNYIDRILNTRKAGSPVRWYPFAYEVIIFQWVALLMEQRRSGEKMKKKGEAPSPQNDYPQGFDPEGKSALTDAANRARGVTISCAPVLFEIIKKSWGWRLHNLFRRTDSSREASFAQTSCPFLMKLDHSIMTSLEYLISSLTDACIDSRNFDSWEFRQTSIDVNDAIVRFLRDLFAFLDPNLVYRLILVYFSRFVVKEGKLWQDRDSKIGLRCSWEVCKLRLNAVTAFIRFQDFTRVNSPQMMSWGDWPLRESSHEARKFFNDSIRSYISLGMSALTDSQGPKDKSISFPEMKPHWLAEIVVDICLSGTEHAEQYIQHRAASLLHELFWCQSQEGRATGTSSTVASMHVTFIFKVLNHIAYLSSLGAKSQLRQDIMPCVVFVVQSAHVGLLRGVWRKLCKAAEGKGRNEKFGVTFTSTTYSDTTINERGLTPLSFDEQQHEPDILDMFSLFNLALSSLEYEGCEEQVETENGAEDSEQIAIWRKEFLPAVEEEIHHRQRSQGIHGRAVERVAKEATKKFTSSTSRKWHSHDAAIVIINTCRYIVREMLFMKSMTGQNVSAGQSATNNSNLRSSFVDQNLHFDGFLDAYKDRAADELCFSDADTVVFVRAASSVYLHCLALRQSDIVSAKALIASVELVKIYGVKYFLQAVGETLQHWMRVVMLHCGSRRAQVRVQALEFLALVLRVTWNSYGSFSRVRLPLLAIQTEVMERIVATAATRFYREQRRMGMHIQSLSNDSAEASLSLLWRTLNRLHYQSASQNVAFRSDVIRLAEKTKKLYRAYIAAHALAILNRSRSPLSPTNSTTNEDDERYEVVTMLQSRRISVHRIIMASAGYCKQFLGPQKAASLGATVAHNEAVEDAFLAAAEVFSPTELPSHRVAWLQKLAEFHASRSKHAEEATCRFQIHRTYQTAARMHESIWSSVPFLPWANDSSGGVHLDGEGPAGDPDDYYDTEYDYEDQVFDDAGSYEMNLGKQLDKTNSFRRIFYRVANSVRMRTGDWEIGGNKNLFYGITFASEYGTVTPWLSLREMEECMVEEAEAAGDLYLKAGIAESSRYAWGLATQFYSIKFNYAKLGHAYRRLSTVVQSRVPVVDTNEQALELSHHLGRFYRVWFHGSAPDELIGAEFVYRAAGSVKLEEFGKLLFDAIKCIIPDNTPIDLVLDDGRPEESSSGWRPPSRRLGPTPMEPVKIKVTPLRPLVRHANSTRGTPEWFDRYTDIPFQPSTPDGVKGLKRSSSTFEKEKRSRLGATHRNRDHARSYSSSMFSSSGSVPSRVSDLGNTGLKPTDPYKEPRGRPIDGGGDLIGVDRFTFFQPVNKKAHDRSSRDWLKSTGDFAEKSLRVTLLHTERSFPACVARQAVTTRTVFTQSPLEAGVNAVCSWCSVLFRTAVATSGLAVLGEKFDGIGKQASKVVSDCIHSSRVKEMGLTLLKKNGSVTEESDTDLGTMMFNYTRLSEEEIKNLQVKLARGIVVFMEILHLLISHNRDLLLEVVDARKRSDSESLNTFGYNSLHRGNQGFDQQRPGSPVKHPFQHTFSWSQTPSHQRAYSGASSIPTDEGRYQRDSEKNDTSNTIPGGNDQTDSAIAIQSELQRAFISMTKALYPHISRVLQNETPRWLKHSSQEAYFSSYAYRQTQIPMAEELCFFAQDDPTPPAESVVPDEGSGPSLVSSAENGLTGLMRGGSAGGGSQSGSIASHPWGSNMHHHNKTMSSDGSYRQVV